MIGWGLIPSLSVGLVPRFRENTVSVTGCIKKGRAPYRGANPFSSEGLFANLKPPVSDERRLL